MSSNTVVPIQGNTQLNQVNEASQTTSSWMDLAWNVAGAIARPFIAVSDAVFNTSWVVPTEDWTDQQEESVVTHDDVQAALDQLRDEDRTQLKEMISQFRSSPEESAQWLLKNTDLGDILFHDFSDKAQAAQFLIANRDQLKFGDPEYSLEELDMTELEEPVKTPSLIYRTLAGKVTRRVYFEEFNGTRDVGNQGLAMSYLDTVSPTRSCGETFIALLEEVEKKASEEGIYRVSPGVSERKGLQSQLTKAGSRDIAISKAGAHVLTGTIKQQLREIPNEKKVLSSQILVALGKDVKNVDKVKGEIAKLPPEKKAFLKLLVDHVAKVAESESKNSMSVNNLAIVIAPNLYQMGNNLSQELSIAGFKNDFFVFLVNNREAIFQA